MKSIRKTIAIQFFATNGATVVNFFLTIILARLLTPAEIGIFSITSVIVSFSHVFRDFGVSAYIRRAKVLTPEILRSATGVLVTSSWVIATLLFFASDTIAAFFKQPGVGQVMRVLAVGFYFIPLGAVPQAVLARELQAEKQALVALVSTPVYATTTLFLAYNGFSYMSMAWANLANIIATGLAFTALRPAGMPWLPSLRGWRRVAHFGVGAMLSSTIKAIDNAVPDVLLGKLTGPRNVGLFSRSNSTVNIFNTIAGPTVNYMALPYLAKIHHDGRDLAAEVARAIALLTGLIWSALAVIASLAPDIIAFLYGPAWAECAPIVPMLCAACAVQATFAFMQPALTGIGRPYWSALPLACGLIAKISLVLLTFSGDLMSFAWIMIAAEIVSIPGYFYLARRYINLPVAALVKSIGRSLAIAAIMIVVTALLEWLLRGYHTPFIRLTIIMTVVTPIWVGSVVVFRHPLREELRMVYRTFLAQLKALRSRQDHVEQSVTIESNSLPPAQSADVSAHAIVAVKKILIYGAIARADDVDTRGGQRKRRHKRLAHELQDRAAWSVGSTAWIDYRNYESQSASNIGDLAIASAIRKQFRKRQGNIFTNVNWGELHLLQSDEIAADHSLLVFAGSGYVFFSMLGKLADRVLQDVQMLEQISTPAVLFGIGVNQPSSSPLTAQAWRLGAEDEATLRRLLARMQLISVRDTTSQALLSLYTDKPVSLIADPALFFADSIGIAAATRSNDDMPRVPHIGLNFAFHGPFSNSILQRNLAVYVRMIKAIYRHTGCRFSYFVHYDTEHLIPRLFAQKGIAINVVNGDAYELSRYYADIDVHIGGMLHSCIMAVGADTPCIGLAYDIKHFGFFDLMNMPDQCFSATEFDPHAIINLTLKLLHAGAEERDRIAARRRVLHSAAQDFIDDCVKLVVL